MKKINEQTLRRLIKKVLLKETTLKESIFGSLGGTIESYVLDLLYETDTSLLLANVLEYLQKDGYDVEGMLTSLVTEMSMDEYDASF